MQRQAVQRCMCLALYLQATLFDCTEVTGILCKSPLSGDCFCAVMAGSSPSAVATERVCALMHARACNLPPTQPGVSVWRGHSGALAAQTRRCERASEHRAPCCSSCLRVLRRERNEQL